MKYRTERNWNIFQVVASIIVLFIILATAYASAFIAAVGWAMHAWTTLRLMALQKPSEVNESPEVDEAPKHGCQCILHGDPVAAPLCGREYVGSHPKSDTYCMNTLADSSSCAHDRVCHERQS